MAYPIRRRALSRRHFLRGSAGACLALPLLDAMIPALSSPAAPPNSIAFIFAPNGKKMDVWTPEKKGKLGKRLPATLEALAPLRGEFSVLSGLGLDGARSHGDGPGDHARAAASFLTSTHPRKTGGSDIQAGVSIDQKLAALMGQETRFPSIELGLEGGRRAGSCDSGYSCAYSNNIAWSSPSTPVAKEIRPREVFERLFGDPTELAGAVNAERRKRRRRSVLDSVADDAKTLRRKLGKQDRGKLDEYLAALRSLERRFDGKNERVAVKPPKGLEPGKEGGFRGRLATMYELMALAFETDQTRVATLMLGNAGSNRSYRFLGVNEGHHFLSHHGKDPTKLEKIAKINRFHIEAFATFLQRLKDTETPTGSLLDRVALVYGSGIADGNRHDHHGLPILIAGGAKGLRTGSHLSWPRKTPLANLYLTLLKRFGGEDTSFGDSQGTLKGIF